VVRGGSMVWCHTMLTRHRNTLHKSPMYGSNTLHNSPPAAIHCTRAHQQQYIAQEPTRLCEQPLPDARLKGRRGRADSKTRGFWSYRNTCMACSCSLSDYTSMACSCSLCQGQAAAHAGVATEGKQPRFEKQVHRQEKKVGRLEKVVRRDL